MSKRFHKETFQHKKNMNHSYIYFNHSLATYHVTGSEEHEYPTIISVFIVLPSLTKFQSQNYEVALNMYIEELKSNLIYDKNVKQITHVLAQYISLQ